MATQTPPAAEPKETPAPAAAPPAAAQVAEPVKAAPAVSEPEPEPEPDDEGEGDDEILTVSPEEKAAILANPALKRIYRGLTKAATQKFQEIAQDKTIIDLMREDPQEAARLIANAAGLRLAQEAEPAKAAPGAAEAVADAVTAKLEAIFGADVTKELKPVLEDIVRTTVAQAAAPYAEQIQNIAYDTIATKTETEVEAFRQKHPGEITKVVEQKMVELSKKLPAGEHVSPAEYMELLYTFVSAGKDKGAVVKEVVTRMAKAGAANEPSGIPAAKVESAPSFAGKNLDEALDMAFDHAKTQMRSR